MAKRYNILTRCLAALALLFVYVVSTSAILVGATTSSAQAQWRGRGGGWGRGYGRLWLLWRPCCRWPGSALLVERLRRSRLPLVT